MVDISRNPYKGVLEEKSGRIWVRAGLFFIKKKKGEYTQAHKNKNTTLIPGTLYTLELTIYKQQGCFLGPNP